MRGRAAAFRRSAKARARPELAAPAIRGSPARPADDSIGLDKHRFPGVKGVRESSTGAARPSREPVARGGLTAERR
jgi:hypothetical protein